MSEDHRPDSFREGTPGPVVEAGRIRISGAPGVFITSESGTVHITVPAGADLPAVLAALQDQAGSVSEALKKIEPPTPEAVRDAEWNRLTSEFLLAGYTQADFRRLLYFATDPRIGGLLHVFPDGATYPGQIAAVLEAIEANRQDHPDLREVFLQTARNENMRQWKHYEPKFAAIEKKYQQAQSGTPSATSARTESNQSPDYQAGLAQAEDRYESQLTSLRAQLTEALQEIQTAKADLASLEGTIARLEADKTRLSAEWTRRGIQNIEAAGQIRELEETVRALKARLGESGETQPETARITPEEESPAFPPTSSSGETGNGESVGGLNGEADSYRVTFVDHFSLEGKGMFRNMLETVQAALGDASIIEVREFIENLPPARGGHQFRPSEYTDLESLVFGLIDFVDKNGEYHSLFEALSRDPRFSQRLKDTLQAGKLPGVRVEEKTGNQ